MIKIRVGLRGFIYFPLSSWIQISLCLKPMGQKPCTRSQGSYNLLRHRKPGVSCRCNIAIARYQETQIPIISHRRRPRGRFTNDSKIQANLCTNRLFLQSLIPQKRSTNGSRRAKNLLTQHTAQVCQDGLLLTWNYFRLVSPSEDKKQISPDLEDRFVLSTVENETSCSLILE